MGQPASAASMPRPPLPPPLARFVSDADEWALFLDFDGTLIELAESPRAIRVPADLPELLRRAREAVGGALAILTGRSLADLDHYLAPAEFAAAGQHGAEFRFAPGRVELAAPPPALAHAREKAAALAAETPGLVVEDKGASLALHYRGCPWAGANLEAFVQSIAAASREQLEVVAGKFVYELRPRGTSKGAALDRFLATPPFRGRKALVFGDDVTDESAFGVALARAGAAIKVGAGASRAAWRLAAPADVRRWLAKGTSGEES